MEENLQIVLKEYIKNVEDVSLELGKGLKKDKRKICNLLFALHNLPRVYLSKEANTLLMMG